MPHGMKLNELYYRRLLLFSKESCKEEFDVSKILSRKVECFFERHNYYPADLFFLNYNQIQFFGRKTISNLYLEGKQEIKKCNQINAHMLLGLVIREQTTEKGILIFYKPLTNSEKLYLFNQMKINQKVDIYFPHPVLSRNLNEFVQSNNVWEPDENLIESLNHGEEHIRAYTLQYLSQFNLADKKIYDPACSTGKFLDTIKRAYPSAYVIGQDINKGMIDYARKNTLINELYHGDSINPVPATESVDFIFFRFLNLSVVSAEQALKLFCRISNCCKNGGTLIIFGFTPVLLGAEIFSILGLDVQQTIAYSKENDSVFQFYVLKKNSTVPQLRYEQFSVFNFARDKLIDDAKDIHQTSIIRSKL